MVCHSGYHSFNNNFLYFCLLTLYGVGVHHIVPCDSQSLGTNIVTNPGAEYGSTFGWTTDLGTPSYKSGSLTGTSGSYYWYGGGTTNSQLSQRINIGYGWSRYLKRCGLTATFSAWLGGYSTQTDQCTITFALYTLSGTKIGYTYYLGPVDETARGGYTELQYREITKVKIPSNTYYIDVTMIMYGPDGFSNNDGYADDVTVKLYATTCTETLRQGSKDGSPSVSSTREQSVTRPSQTLWFPTNTLSRTAEKKTPSKPTRTYLRRSGTVSFTRDYPRTRTSVTIDLPRTRTSSSTIDRPRTRTSVTIDHPRTMTSSLTFDRPRTLTSQTIDKLFTPTAS
eukprot:PhF_6_TR5612/c0_g1_i3/m.8115